MASSIGRVGRVTVSLRKSLGRGVKRRNLTFRAASRHAALRHRARGLDREHGADALERFLDPLETARVAEAEIPLAVRAEGRARERRDAGVEQELVLEVLRGEAGARDVREGVERAL